MNRREFITSSVATGALLTSCESGSKFFNSKKIEGLLSPERGPTHEENVALLHSVAEGHVEYWKRAEPKGFFLKPDLTENPEEPAFIKAVPTKKYLDENPDIKQQKISDTNVSNSIENDLALQLQIHGQENSGVRNRDLETKAVARAFENSGLYLDRDTLQILENDVIPNIWDQGHNFEGKENTIKTVADEYRFMLVNHFITMMLDTNRFVPSDTFIKNQKKLVEASLLIGDASRKVPAYDFLGKVGRRMLSQDDIIKNSLDGGYGEGADDGTIGENFYSWIRNNKDQSVRQAYIVAAMETLTTHLMSLSLEDILRIHSSE